MMYNLEIEKSVLSTLLTNGTGFDKIEGIVTDKDFYAERHKIIFQAATELYQAKLPYDVLMVNDKLETENKLSLVGGEEYLGDILTAAGTFFNLEPYAQRIKDFSQRRSAIETLKQGIENLESFDETTDTLLNDSISQLNQVMLQSNKNQYSTAGELLQGFYEKLLAVTKDGVKPFIGTGFAVSIHAPA